ncbi:MAG: UvrD-helicase domain-containing protein [Planctomycetes bacterium]|nr:UvrD-helicase domain-containing protein [Planctomycetota bacterium]
MNETRASVEDFDLGRHAVVEASAGTGKTYTIENLVLRLLTEQDVELHQILVVTFTEKATGELKVRLRQTLERALRKNDEYAPRLKESLDHFDQAPIFTIHGFCHRLMQEFALEQGHDFAAEQTDDGNLLQTLLREIQRKDWRREFGPALRALLEQGGFPGTPRNPWGRRVLEIARRYKPQCGHLLHPALKPNWWRTLDAPDADVAGQLEVFTIERLRERLGEVKRERGLVSFDDMISVVEESLDPQKNTAAESLVSRLRQRFQYGIVDEFQDTDPLQWRIFRRIFLDKGDSRLFIVGDPKQAIFGFRGADLPTYLAAAKQMIAEHGASVYALPVNWRSEVNLLEGLNCIFGDGEWFSAESGISYLHVKAPDGDCPQVAIETDRSDRAAVSLVDLTHCEKIKGAQKQFARFIAYEIDRMVRGPDGPLMSISLKGSPARAIHAGDFCVLVTKRADALPIIEALDAADITYSFYKQTGLWASDEANHLEVLLQTLARPDERASFRKALLTCFFRVSAEELALAPDVPMQHPARRLYQAWLGYAVNREWSSLFRSLLEDTGVLGGNAGINVDRLRQLLTTLEQVGHAFNFDLLGLLDWVRERRQQPGTGEAEMQPDETGVPKVKIMTMHACKGLEFPFVFLAGGFTKGQNSNAFAIYHDDDDRLVFDLRVDEEAKERVKSEYLSEQSRLFYVALTRPIFKLYLPKVTIPPKSANYLGPVGTILHPALERSCPEKLGPLVADVVAMPLAATVAPRPEEAPAKKERSVLKLKGPLFPRIDADLGKRRIVVRSFSSLAKHHLAQAGEGASFGDEPKPSDDEAPAPPDRDDPLRGPVFGDMVHNVIERIDFAEVARAATSADLCRAGAHARKLMDREIRANIAGLRSRAPIENLEQTCREQIASLIWHTLRTPLADLGARLCDIPRGDRIHEIDFLFPEIPDDETNAGFVSGFMDLLLRKGNKYYLLDWKTNLLPGYTREQIERSMTDSDYHRQHRLYLNAARRWLERVHGAKFSFLERLGGVYYLYVRGMNGRDDSSGVYFHQPTADELDLKALLK